MGAHSDACRMRIGHGKDSRTDFAEVDKFRTLICLRDCQADDRKCRQPILKNVINHMKFERNSFFIEADNGFRR